MRLNPNKSIEYLSEMKDQSKIDKPNKPRNIFIRCTVNDALNKYAGPDFLPEKVKKIEGKFRK